MKLVIITGPHAVGKMTVGQELAKATGLRLFHNHMTIDIVSGLFDQYPEERRRLTEMFREEIFHSYLKTNEYGMIFTFMWAFDCQEDWDYLDHVETMFRECGSEVYYVELEADYNLRWERNKTENRLLNKPSKRDIKKSEQLFQKLEEEYRLNSLPGEINKEHYLRINNTNMDPIKAAKLIKDTFHL